MNEVFVLEKGKVEYGNFYNALKVAEAKAQEENRPIVIFRKVGGYKEPVSRVFPDGKREDLRKVT